VRPKHYSWTEFYDRLVDLSAYSFSWRAIGRRFAATRTQVPRWMNVLRGVSSEGFGRIRYHTSIRRKLDEDRSVRAFFDGESEQVPQFYLDLIRRELGPAYDYLPEGALTHDHNAYLKSSGPQAVSKAQVLSGASRTAGVVEKLA
jgi:hypothetical protein